MGAPNGHQPDAVGAVGTPEKYSWTSDEALLYAVGVGAGTDELQYTTENTEGVRQQVLPTFAVIIGGGGAPFDKIGSFNPALMVHGEQGIELCDEIPPEGEIESVGKVEAIWDKGSAAVVEFSSESTNTATGKPLLRTRTMIFCRGEGGWGGDRGPSEKLQYPDRPADHQVTYQTSPDQALLYRLSGDHNPAALGPGVRRNGWIRSANSAWVVHLRLYRSGTAQHAVRWRRRALQIHERTLLQAGVSGRSTEHSHVGRRQ